MLRDRPPPRFRRLGAVVGREGAGGAIDAPVIEDMRDVADARRLAEFRHAQGQIPVLAALEAKAEAAGAAHQFGPVDAEMADHVLGQEQLRVPVRLEMRLVTPARRRRSCPRRYRSGRPAHDAPVRPRPGRAHGRAAGRHGPAGRVNSPVASSSAELLAAEMWPLTATGHEPDARIAAGIAGEQAAGRPGSVEASSAMQSSQCG